MDWERNIGAEYTYYKLLFVYCRELAPGTVSLIGDWFLCDDSKHNAISATYIVYDS